MNEDLLKKLICAIEKDNCCPKPNRTSTKAVIDVTIERIKGSPGEKQLVVKYDDGSISTKQYTDTSEEGNTYLNKFKEVDGILIGTYNTEDEIQILNTRKFALQRDLRSLSKSIECLKGYSFEDVELDIPCDGSIQNSSCSKPFREGNSVYWINSKGEKEWLFDIPETGGTSDDRFIIELTVNGNGSVNKELLVVRKGMSALIEATPQPGHKFIGWYEGSTLILREASYSFVASSHIVLEARFAPIPKFTVTATSNNTAYGTVSPATQTKEEGVAMTFVATPTTPTSDFSYRFLRWEKNGSSISTNATLTITPTENFAVQAIFERVDLRTYYTHSVTQSTGGNISINPTGRQLANTNIVVTATPSSGYKLKSIKANNTVISSTSPFTHRPTANTVYTAEFEQCTTTTTFEIRGLAGRTGTIDDSNPTATETFTFQVYKTVTGNCLLTPQVSEVTNYTYEVTGNPITNKQNGSFQTTANATKTLTVNVTAEGKTVSKQVTFTVVNNITPDKGAVKLNPTSPVGYTVTSDNATANVVNQCYIDGVGTAYTEVQIKLDTTKESVLNWEIPTNVPSGAITVTLNSDKSIATMKYNCKLLNGLANIIIKLKDRLGRFVSVVLGTYKPAPARVAINITKNFNMDAPVSASPATVDPRVPQNVTLSATAQWEPLAEPGVRYVFKHFTENGQVLASNTLANVSTSRNIVAVYEKYYKITAVSNNTAYGTVAPAESWVKEGSAVSLTASPTSIGVFTRFIGGGFSGINSTSNPTTITNVRSAETITANFNQKTTPVNPTYDYYGIDNNVEFLVCEGSAVSGEKYGASYTYNAKIGIKYINVPTPRLQPGHIIKLVPKTNIPHILLQSSVNINNDSTWSDCVITRKGTATYGPEDYATMFYWEIHDASGKIYPLGNRYFDPYVLEGVVSESCTLSPEGSTPPEVIAPPSGDTTSPPVENPDIPHPDGDPAFEEYVRSQSEFNIVSHINENPDTYADMVEDKEYTLNLNAISTSRVNYLAVGTIYEVENAFANPVAQHTFKQNVVDGINKGTPEVLNPTSANTYWNTYSTGYYDSFRDPSGGDDKPSGIYVHYRTNTADWVMIFPYSA